MKGLYFDQTLNYSENLAKPVPKDNESLVRILVAGICNTDREILKGYKHSFKGILGHEFVGIVEESNNNQLIGKRVVGELNGGCGECYYCRHNLELHCEKREIIGMSIDGCFAEYMAIRTDLLHVIPDDLSAEKAMFTEPLAAAFSILNTGHIKPTDQVALIGDGRLAYMIGQVISYTGCDLTVIGLHEEKLAKFKPFANTEIETNQAYDIVIDATGSPEGMKTAVKIVRSRGEIIVKSTYAEQLCLNFSEIVVREIRIRGTRCGPFEPALKFLNRQWITLPEAKFFELENYEEAFSSRAFKAGFRISEE